MADETTSCNTDGCVGAARWCPRCGVARCAEHAGGQPCVDCKEAYCGDCVAAFGAVADDGWRCNGCGPPACTRPECAARIEAWEAAHPDRPEGFEAGHCATTDCHGIVWANGRDPAAEGYECANCGDTYCTACCSRLGTMASGEWYCADCDAPP